jgi:tRNA(Leu) C34 or U34 (ribose-2'-O)-methylase TrmL
MTPAVCDLLRAALATGWADLNMFDTDTVAEALRAGFMKLASSRVAGQNLRLTQRGRKAVERVPCTSLVLTRVKYPHNLAAAIRAAACFGAEQVLWTGHRFTFSEGERLPREERMKGYRHVAVHATELWVPHLGAGRLRIVGVEIVRAATALTDFVHPQDCDVAYVFGPEDGGLDKATRVCCHEFVYIPARHCLNLAAAVNVVLFHRALQRGDRTSPAVTEERGP